MATTSITPESVENFLHDRLREDLRVYERQLQQMNAETMEYVQLKNTLETIQRTCASEPFKTQVNIGGNFFMQARADSVERILVDVGLQVYVDFSLEEALKFVDMKIKVLTKQADVVRDQSVETRANIKLALLVLGEAGRYPQQSHRDVR